MPRNSEQNQRIKDERREQIMRAGLKIFAQKGLAATKISDIAAMANLSYGLVYHYFHDKEELYYTLVERALQGSTRVTARALEQPGSAWDRLVGLVTDMVDGIRRTPEYFWIVLQVQVTEPPSSGLQTMIQRYGLQTQENVISLIRLAQEEGQVTSNVDARELAIMLLSIMPGLSLTTTMIGQTSISYTDNDFPSVETILRFFRP
ncbi:MAG TPA: TetR/AcrR family transcriptional regulator [Ktedonobacterales bacterium]|nr:TetR/AcrR family transcriptional regulator [Ktedonobacterales bacterium]